MIRFHSALIRTRDYYKILDKQDNDFFMELDENTGSGLNNFGKVMFLQVEAN